MSRPSTPIPLNSLTDSEVEQLIETEARKRTVQIQAKVVKAREHTKQKKKLQRKFQRDLKDAQAGKRKMKMVAPSQIGRMPASPPGQGFDSMRIAQAFTEHQLIRLGYLEYPKALASNLLGKIVAPFALENWKGKLRPTDKRALRPVLQLADRLILSATSVKFCHAIMFNKRVKDEKASLIWGKRLVQLDYDQSQKVPVGRLYRPVCNKLHEIRSHVTWQLFDGAESKMHEADAYTAFRKEGFGSDIFLNDENVHLLGKLRNKRTKNVRLTNSILRLQFYIATLLCHELMHAFYRFVTQRRQEPFFGNQSLTEIGWAWEQEALGGVSEWFGPDRDTLTSHYAKPLAIVKWPDCTPMAKGVCR